MTTLVFLCALRALFRLTRPPLNRSISVWGAGVKRGCGAGTVSGFKTEGAYPAGTLGTTTITVIDVIERYAANHLAELGDNLGPLQIVLGAAVDGAIEALTEFRSGAK